MKPISECKWRVQFDIFNDVWGWWAMTEDNCGMQKIYSDIFCEIKSDMLSHWNDFAKINGIKHYDVFD